MPGFKRYEISKCDNGDVWRTCPDHVNNITIYKINSKMYVRVKVGQSAMWILPINKILLHVKENDFIKIPNTKHKGINGLKEYYSYSYWEKYFIPLIPLNRIDECFVNHMSNSYTNYYASIQITELYMQMNICRTKNGLKYVGPNKNRVIKIDSKNSKKCLQIKSC